MVADKFDVLVVGAGVVGCAAAKAFSDQGRRVGIIDRHLDEPHRVVSEVLQPGGVAALSKLGLDDCLDDIESRPLNGYHLSCNGEEASFCFPSPASGERQKGEHSDSDSSASVKAAGRSFRHGPFVSRLRQRLQKEPNVTYVEGSVVEFIRSADSGAVIGIIIGDELLTKVCFAHVLEPLATLLTFVAVLCRYDDTLRRLVIEFQIPVSSLQTQDSIKILGIRAQRR